MDLRLHDKVELKKPHPCGSTQWEILRVGMDIKLKCLGCGAKQVHHPLWDIEGEYILSLIHI